jgi:hypothetical protein
VPPQVRKCTAPCKDLQFSQQHNSPCLRGARGLFFTHPLYMLNILMTQFSLIIRVRWVITYIQIEIFYARINIIPPAWGGLGGGIKLFRRLDSFGRFSISLFLFLIPVCPLPNHPEPFPPACGGLGGNQFHVQLGLPSLKDTFQLMTWRKSNYCHSQIC